MGSRARYAPPTCAESKAAGVPSERGRFLRLPDVIATTGLSRPTIYRRIADGDFPASIKIARQAVGWWEADVVRWLEERRHAA